MKTLQVFLAFLLLSGVPAVSQTDVNKPVVRSAAYFDVLPPLRQILPIQPVKVKGDLREIPNKVGHHEFGNLTSNSFPFPEDQVWQKTGGSRAPVNSVLLQNFDGITNISYVYPPDTQGDVSDDAYVQVVNMNFAVYSKSGAVLLGPLALSTIWNGIPSPWNGTNNGDPVVLYDQAADRWLITQFSLPYGNYAELVAVSQTSDPTGPWYRYVFQFGDKMPDYPKFGVWSDGYYMSANQFINGAYWGGVGACAFERTKMLTGDPTAAMVYFDLGSSGDPAGMLPSDWDGTTPPVPGEPNYFMYFNDWSSFNEDYLKIWEFHADWVTPANSTFALVSSLVTSPFDADLCLATRGRCITQPGTTVKLESLSDRLMYRLQYRNFGDHQSMVTNHTVDVNGSGRAGIRWYELRNSGAGWSVNQQGTWSPDSANRWVGSVAMNSRGDIALGYSVSDATSVYPSIRLTGRLANDTPGTMTIPEQTIIAGSGNQTGSAARWGDYSMMSVDPSDDLTFWYTTEYIQSSGSANWKTRIASFLFDNIPSVTTLSASALTANSATLNGTISPNGLPSTWYFEWGLTTAYGNTTSVVSAGSGTTSLPVNATLQGLTGGQTYHYRLVGTNSQGTATGNDMVVSPGLATVTTASVNMITQTGAVSGGNVTSDGGSPVTARGVCWATTSNPVVSGNHTTDGTGTGSFISAVSGLSPNTTWFLRAYATNATGTYYGAERTFTTLCDVVTSFPWTEGFEHGSMNPACWSQEQVNGSGISWEWTSGNGNGYPATAHTGLYNGCLRDMTPADNRTRLITPVLDLTSVSNARLKFWHTQTETDGNQDQLSVYYKTVPAGQWTFLTTFTNNISEWTEETVELPGSLTTCLIAFDGNAKSGRGVCIDDIEVSSGCTQFVQATVSVVASANPVCSGTMVTLTATPENGGTNPSFLWKVNEITSGYGTPTFNYFPAGGDTVMCIMTSNAPCITGNPALSNNVIFSVTPSPVAGVSVTASMNPVCSGTSVTFVATPSNLEPNPRYQWKVNGINKGKNSATYTCVPVNNDVVTCVLTSYLECITGSPATSDAITMTVIPLQQAGVLITVAANPVASGFPVTFTATGSNSGSAPAFQWKVNGINAGSNTPLFTYTPANNDLVTCSMTSSAACLLANPVVSNTISMVVTAIPSSVDLQNMTVGSVACFEAAQTIRVAGNGTAFTVATGGNATMIAGQNILIFPETVVLPGGRLHGYIASDGQFCPVTQRTVTPQNIEPAIKSGSGHVSVYPNPAGDKFTLFLPTQLPVDQKISVIIYDMKGAQVLKQDFFGGFRQEFFVPEFRPGLYLVRVLAGRFSGTIRLIIEE